MNLKLLLVLLVLSLTACGQRFAKDDSPASDVDALVMNVAKTTGKVLLPNGREYCAELAVTEDEQDDCTGDLEDALYRANLNSARTLVTVRNYATRERLRRNPCSWWERVLRRARCEP